MILSACKALQVYVILRDSNPTSYVNAELDIQHGQYG